MGIIETMKEVVGLVQKIDDVELLRQIVTMQTQVSDLTVENVALKARVAELTTQLELRAVMQFDGHWYWKGAGRASSDGPFCATCWDAHGRFNRPIVSDQDEFAYCNVCQRTGKPPRR